MGTFEDDTQEGRSKEEPCQEGSGEEGTSQEDHRKEGSSQEGSCQEDGEEGHGQEVASKEEDHHQEVRFLLQLLRGATVIDLPCSFFLWGRCMSIDKNEPKQKSNSL